MRTTGNISPLENPYHQTQINKKLNRSFTLETLDNPCSVWKTSRCGYPREAIKQTSAITARERNPIQKTSFWDQISLLLLYEGHTIYNLSNPTPQILKIIFQFWGHTNFFTKLRNEFWKIRNGELCDQTSGCVLLPWESRLASESRQKFLNFLLLLDSFGKKVLKLLVSILCILFHRKNLFLPDVVNLHRQKYWI